MHLWVIWNHHTMLDCRLQVLDMNFILTVLALHLKFSIFVFLFQRVDIWGEKFAYWHFNIWWVNDVAEHKYSENQGVYGILMDATNDNSGKYYGHKTVHMWLSYLELEFWCIVFYSCDYMRWKAVGWIDLNNWLHFVVILVDLVFNCKLSGRVSFKIEANCVFCLGLHWWLVIVLVSCLI